MKNRALALAADSIPYLKELRTLTGSVTATILMQQLDYRFNHKPNGFYKFLAPCANAAYKAGDSWTEELGFSKEEFRSAFAKIGLVHESKTAYDGAIDAFIDENGKEYYYACYHDRIKGLTFYFRNHTYTDAAIERLFSRQPQSTEVGNPNPRKPATPIYGSRQPQSTEVGNPNLEYKETKKTTEKTTESVCVPTIAETKTSQCAHTHIPADTPFTTQTDEQAKESLVTAISEICGIAELPNPQKCPITAAVLAFTSLGITAADVRAFDHDWYQVRRKTFPLTLDILRKDIGAFTRSRRILAETQTSPSAPARPTPPKNATPGELKRYMEQWNKK